MHRCLQSKVMSWCDGLARRKHSFEYEAVAPTLFIWDGES